jgi:6-phosphofructokinase 1
MITLQDNMTRVVAIPYDEMMDADTGRTGVRMVDIEGIAYQSARKFQIRLDRGDFEDVARLQALAAQTNKTPDQFKERFGYLCGLAPRPAG